MSFLDSLGETLQDAGWFVGAPVAAVFDMAKAQADDDPSTNFGSVVSTAFNRGTQLFFGDNMGTPDDKSDDVHNAIDQPIGKVMDGLEWVYDNAIAQPINTVNIMSERAMAGIAGVDDGQKPWWNVEDAWHRADETTGGYGGTGTSIGREWANTVGGIRDFLPDRWGKDDQFASLTNEGQEQLDKHSKMYDVQSGAIDTVARVTLDPTIVLGKANKALRLAHVVSEIKDPATIGAKLEKTADSFFAGFGKRHEAAMDFIVQPRSDGASRSAGEIYSAFKGLQDTNDGMLMAQLMEQTVNDMRKVGASTPDIAQQVSLISRAGMGDADAVLQIKDAASAAKDALAASRSDRDELATAQNWALQYSGRPGYVSPYSEAKGLAAAQNVAKKYNFAEDVESRGRDYFSSEEFLAMANARMNAVKNNFTAAESEAARLSRTASNFTGDNSMVNDLAKGPLLAGLRQATTKGLEKRADEFSGLRKPFKPYPAQLDFIVQSNAFNLAVKVTMPHIALAVKAHQLFNSPAQPRVLEFHDPNIAMSLNNFLRHSAINPQVREGLVSEMAAASDEGAKRAVTTKAIAAAQESMVDKYKAANPRFTDETAQIVKHEMSKQIAWERDRITNQVKKFTAHLNKDGRPGDVRFDDKTGMASYHALLETQLENRMILPNLKTFERVLSRHANTLTDMSAWAKGDRVPDQGNVKELAAKLFDHKIGDSTLGQKLAPIPEALNKASWKTDRFIIDALTRFNTAWKFAALLRPAYPMRVLVDSDLRVLARTGPAAFAMHVMPRAFGFATAGGATRMKQLFAQRADDDLSRALETEIENFEDAWHGSNTGPIDDAEYLNMKKDLDTIRSRMDLASKGRAGRRQAYGTFGEPGQRSIKTIAGEIPGAFSDEYGQMRRWQYSSETTANLVGDSNKLAMRTLLSDQWVSLDNTAPNHMDSWLHAVNAQLLQSDLGKKALEFQVKNGDDPAKAIIALKQWAKGTPEGRKLMDRLMWTGAAEDHAAEVVGYVNHYIPTPALRKEALGRKLNQGDLETAYPDPLDRPPVHGQALAMSVGRGSYSGKVANDFMSRTMRWLSDAPEDQLARHPLYAAVYEQEAKRQAELLLANPRIIDVTGADIKNLIQNKAHKAAGHAVKSTMFDIAARSDLSEAMRFVSPFISAWEDTVRKWGRLVAEDPSILGKAYAAWNIPNGMGLVVDENGNKVDGRDGFNDNHRVLMQWPSWAPGPLTRIDPNTGERVGKQLDLLPGTSLNKLTHGAINADNTDFRLPKQAVNIILQGGLQPGFGPLVAIPVGKLQVAQPEIDDVAKLVNPFGPPESVYAALAPASLKRLTEVTNQQSRAHLQDTEQMFMQMQGQYRLDPEKFGGKPPTWDEAARRANAMGRLKILNNFINPFPLQFESKYQLYIDSYHTLKREENDPNKNHEYGWADDQFIKKFGDSFFPLVQSMSKNNAGLTSSAEAVSAAKKFKGLIAQYGTEAGVPNSTLIRLIVGPEGEGQFNQSAHRWQESREISPGSGQNYRTNENPQEAAAQADANLGWYKYRQFMNNLNAMANQQGLKTYQDDDVLIATRKQFIDNLNTELPAWRVDWDSMDQGKFDRNLASLTDIAQSNKYGADRTDMAGVREYVALRQALTIKADEYGITPTSADAAPLREEFTQAVLDLVSQNTQFSEFAFNGFLERDPLLSDDLVSAAQPPAPTDDSVIGEWGISG